MKYLIDTNIFIRVLIEDKGALFEECKSLLNLIKKNNIEAYTVSVVLAEIVWTLSSYYKFSKQSVIRAVKGIINLKGLKIIDSYDHLQALMLYENNKVKYIDALIASVILSSYEKTTIISYDHDFDKLEITRREPTEVLIELRK